VSVKGQRRELLPHIIITAPFHITTNQILVILANLKVPISMRWHCTDTLA